MVTESSMGREQANSLEARMLQYEQAFGTRFMPLLPVLARLDGRSFSTFTRHTKKPFSPQFRRHMLELTQFLVVESGATVGYSQSDEITLAWAMPTVQAVRDMESQTVSKTRTQHVFFDGRLQKMCSTLAGLAAVKFAAIGRGDIVRDDSDEATVSTPVSGCAWHMMPTFDCRVWAVPNLTEAANVFVWRQAAASRNSVQMVARHYFSHKQCLGRSTSEMQGMLHSRGINWNDYDADSKRGTFIRKVRVERKYTPAEIESLPPKHNARKTPNLVLSRNEIQVEDLWLTKIENREDALFRGATPVWHSDPKCYDCHQAYTMVGHAAGCEVELGPRL